MKSSTVRIAWIALFAALMHMLLPTVHAATSPNGFVTYLCSPDGTRIMPGVTLGDSPTDTSSSHKATMAGCLLCAAGAHVGLTPAPRLHAVAAPHLSHVLAVSSQAYAAPQPLRVQFLSRAPPQA